MLNILNICLYLLFVFMSHQAHTLKPFLTTLSSFLLSTSIFLLHTLYHTRFLTFSSLLKTTLILESHRREITFVIVVTLRTCGGNKDLRAYRSARGWGHKLRFKYGATKWASAKKGYYYYKKFHAIK